MVKIKAILDLYLLKFSVIFYWRWMCMYYFPMAAITNCHKLGSLKHRNVLSQFWKLVVSNQRVDKVELPLTALEEDTSLPLSASGNSNCTLLGDNILLIFFHFHIALSSMCSPLLLRTFVIGFRANLIQDNHISKS